MAGTGLPTGDQRPVLLQPSPLVASDSSAADGWGRVADGAAKAASAFMGVADRMEEQARLKWAADFELGARAKRIELQAEHPDDPKAFESAWRGYSDGVLGGVPLAYADHARKTLGSEGLSSLASIQAAATTKQRALAADSVKARLDVAQADVLGYAYRGQSSDERFVQGLADFKAYLNDGVRAGLWSQDHADRKADELNNKAKAESIVGQARAMFEAKGPEAAYAETEALLTNPDLRLTPGEIESYRGRASAEINKWQGFRHADLQRAQQTAAAVTERYKLGTVTEDEARGTAGALAAAGDRVGAAKVMRGYATQEILAADAWQPVTAVDASIGQQRQRVRPYAEKVVGSENATGNPAAQNPNSSATGDGQFIKSTWLDLIKRTAPEVAAGKSDAEILALRADPALSRRMIQAYGDENRAELRAAGLPSGDGEAYLAHFAGLGGAKAVLRADPATLLRDLLTPDAIAANAGMRVGGKAFADWTAGDLRGWAAGKMGDTVDGDTLTARVEANRKKEAAIRDDALSYVSSIRGGPQLPALDWSRPDAAVAALGERERISRMTASSFQTGGPVPALTKPEIEILKSAWDSADSGRRAQIVGTLSRGLSGDVRIATLEKIAGDKPVFAAAGMLYGQNQELALSVVRGQSQIDQGARILPPDSKFMEDVNQYLGTAYANMPQHRAAVIETAKARYADLSATQDPSQDPSGKVDFSGVYNDARMKRALADVTGGVVKWSGSSAFTKNREVIPPKPGMSSDDFGKLVSTLTDADFGGAVTAGNTPLTAKDFHRLSWLESVGPGQYTVWLGSGAVKKADGKPFVLDLNGRDVPKMSSGYTASSGVPDAYVTGGAAATYR